MSTNTAAARVFVRHADEDKAIVSALVELLETALLLGGQDIFCTCLPGRGPATGERLDFEIERRVKEAKAFLYVVTKNSLRSEWARNEVSLRQTLPTQVRARLPVRLPDVPVDSLPAALRVVKVPALTSAAVVYELLRDVASKLSIELQPPEMYQEKVESVLRASRARALAPEEQELPRLLPGRRRLLRLFVVGSGVGQTIFMLPIGPNSDAGEFDKFLALLVDLDLSDSAEYRELARVGKLPASASMIRQFTDALSAIGDLIDRRGSEQERQWFKAGQLLYNYAIRRARAEQSADSADVMLQDADAMLSALDTLVDQLDLPKGLAAEMSAFIARARANTDAETLLKKANDVVNCAYFLL
ncbi:MAG: toll/interleukin-1 receptor domain-containing protein [Gammaproteobacteria bacterium]|nr:toll/interleukin-1 receptor domain-containing protein [Gammaproteobacteria bacterium]